MYDKIWNDIRHEIHSFRNTCCNEYLKDEKYRFEILEIDILDK